MASKKKSSAKAKKKPASKREPAFAARLDEANAAHEVPKALGVLFAVPRSAKNDRAAREIADRVVDRTLGADWQVSDLGPGSRDFRARHNKLRRMSSGEAWDIVYRLRADEEVIDAEPELIADGVEPSDRISARSSSTGDDEHLPGTNAPNFDWSLDQCRVREAWSIAPAPGGTARGRGIRVGHPDTGYTKHPEIFSNRLRVRDGHDFLGNDDDAQDPLDGMNPGHGTKTSSVIISDAPANPGAGERVDGVAPEAELVPIRVTNTVVLFGFGNLSEAIYLAVDKGCHVISISLGGPIKSGTLHRAIQHAVENGVVVLAAAGNVFPLVVYPARFDEVIAVAATNVLEKTWRKSAHGSPVDVSAPGESVWHARTNPDTRQFEHDRGSGTSYAVATTAGVCALWLSHWGRQNLIQKYGASQIAAIFKRLVMDTVHTPNGWNTGEFGAGIVNAEALLNEPLPMTVQPAGLRVRSSSAPRPLTTLDDIAPFFPSLTRDRLRRNVAKFLNTGEAELPEVLREVGDELQFHVAVDPDVRAQIQQPKARPRAAKRPVRRGTGTAQAAAALAERSPQRTMSSELIRRTTR